MLKPTLDLFKETIGQYAGSHARHRMKARGIIGQKLSNTVICSRLTVMRRFFNDLQNRPHSVRGADARTIPLLFKPGDALETPAVVDKAVAAMTPRDIDLLVWQKLAGAAATLTAEDVAGRKQPLSLYKALALLWISTARRRDELMRLRLECIRRDHATTMIDEDGALLENGEQALESEKGKDIWYLRIPTNKYGGEFWIWIPPYVAMAIDEWTKERGKCNPATWDEKDREFADLLFVQRGAPIDTEFLNHQLIPLLCRKAGVPLTDAKGAITSHRGRSTRLTLLRLCGMSLEDLAEYAGHKDMGTIKRYARTFPIHLHRKVAQADTLSREIEGLIDLDAAAQGKPALRWFLGYDPNGSPSFCGLPAHQTCPHRLDCPHCGLHIGGEDAKLLCESDNVQPIWTRIPVPEPERLLSDGQVKAAEEAMGQLSAIPTPIPPSAAFLTNPVGLSEDRMSELATLGTSDAHLQLTMVRDDCQARLAAQQGKDRRNALVRGLRNRLAFAEKCVEECKRQDAVPA